MRVIVVGAGIAGLTAARDLARKGHRVTVLEASDRVGGKIRGESVAGHTVDVGAEAMLNRRPEGVSLAREAGLEVVHPTDAKSAIWSRGALRPIPRSIMGVPLDLPALEAAGLLSEETLEVVRREPTLPPAKTDEDVSVGDFIASRFGDETADRLADPLLAGVYAGHARAISVKAAAPQLFMLAEKGSLLEAAAALPTSTVPVFAGIEGGMSRLPATLAEGLDIRLETPVDAVTRTPQGFLVETGGEVEAADAVVVATPAPQAAKLLRSTAPAVARELSAIETASVAVITFAFPDLPAELTGRSGFLVPPVEESAIKASTFSFAKWAWVGERGNYLRTSIGRHGEPPSDDDDRLVADSLAALEQIAGLTVEPLDVHVQRWTDALPQYPVGHLDRVARIRQALRGVPGLALAGASYDGVGIPATIGSAHRAAGEIG
ncbi:oxygen-dependent protoporphyrinogen oxidase [Nocardioides luteus]|uniref:Coproporphyrinogen III oxidase n=1 Tax=Nocardioides luteus TaxID=1844 RepID=A0ABQ5SXI9_9ACTN|nr:protoporphyrinogen oxidase [Nocardioides luteus]MDR7312056.1 oxygen-dependent protoporphyrinogen oxidase [Nocardioides luteus]GGR72273.1 protoporphyrinogen oxidase [Nocardioides luteus]GLJ68303.1 protoporphyrinogen oxidase [Nocardioides luteus]